VALELMSCLDNEAHSPLDWAADAGDVNMIEYLIRKGFNPCRVDNLNRSPLFWAVKNNRIDAARFLVKCGCDPYLKDSKQQSPFLVAKSIGSWDLIRSLLQFQTTIFTKNLQSVLVSFEKEESNNANNIGTNKLLFSIKHWKKNKNKFKLYTTIRKKKVSHALYRHKESRIGHAIAYWLIVFAFWLLTKFIPFYAWIIVFIVSGSVFRFFYSFLFR
jgi:ankyrin repeat protein